MLMAQERRDVVITGDAEAPGNAACSGAHQGPFAESRLKNTVMQIPQPFDQQPLANNGALTMWLTCRKRIPLRPVVCDRPLV
jgi:hypothetical protein